MTRLAEAARRHRRGLRRAAARRRPGVRAHPAGEQRPRRQVERGHALESVSLTFNEDISAEFASISVVGPDGTNYATGPVSAAGGQVSTAVSPLGPAGAYEIGYRVVSDDGHPCRASWPSR